MLRGISEIEVERTISHHHTSYTDVKGNPIYLADIDGRRIKVVVVKDSDPPHVITTAD